MDCRSLELAGPLLGPNRPGCGARLPVAKPSKGELLLAAGVLGPARTEIECGTQAIGHGVARGYGVESQVIAKNKRDARHVRSYSLRILLVFSWCSAPFSPALLGWLCPT